MGMTESFSPRADFSGISENPLSMRGIIQKAVIEVSEEEPEVAADVQPSSVRRMTLLRTRMVYGMRVDHPFAYYVYDKSFDIVLFSGYVRSPSTS